MNNNITIPQIVSFFLHPTHQRILILSHTRPDADTLGSAFALKAALRFLGKETYCTCDMPIPKRLQFLSDGERVPPSFEPDCIVSVDVASLPLLGENAARYAGKVDVMIDHHGTNLPFGTYHYTEPDIGATAEIIFEIIEEMDKNGSQLLSIPEICIPLYAGISSDTGSFKYSNVTPETHLRIAKLLQSGMNHSEVTRLLYESRPLSQVMATKASLNALRFYQNNKIAVINFTREMKQEGNFTDEDIDDIISITRSIEGVEVGVSIKPKDANSYKVSLRTGKEVNAAELCSLFGGGGHIRAAGCTIEADSPSQAEQKMIDTIVEKIYDK